MLADIDDAILPAAAEVGRILSDSVLASELAGAADVAAKSGVPASQPAAAAPPGSVIPPTRTEFDLPDGLRLRFPAAEDAAAVLRDKPVISPRDFRATAAEVQRGSFAVTGELTDDTLNKLRDLLLAQIVDGGTKRQFLDQANELFVEGTGLSEAHLSTVFRNNIGGQISDAVERALESPLVLDEFPYRMYVATHDNRVRPEHRALETAGLNGTAVYNAQDRVFVLFRPPWDYNCRCTATPLSVEDAAERGVQEARDWLRRAQDFASSRGTSAALELTATAPATFEMVPWPMLNGQPIQPRTEFRRS